MTFVPFVNVAVDPSFPLASTRLRLHRNAFYGFATRYGPKRKNSKMFFQKVGKKSQLKTSTYPIMARAYMIVP